MTADSEPKGSVRPSPYDPCEVCGHARRKHRPPGQSSCTGCDNGTFHTFAPAGTNTSLHKWIQCSACGHPQHSMKCRFGGTPNSCGCLTLTAVNEIARTCRLGGGCPEHPVLRDLPEPQDPASSSEDEKCRCGHARRWHYQGRGTVHCNDCDKGRQHAFTPESPPEPEAPRGEPTDGCPEKAQPARRPPYAVAYAVEGGVEYEIALSGDASVRAIDGVLVIAHSSAVLALSNVRPVEGQ